MPVQDGAIGDQEGGEGGKATGRGRIAGGEENGDEAAVIPSLVGLRRRWTTRMRMTDKDEDDGGGRRHKATTNPMMATIAAVADNDGDGGRRRQR